MSEGGAPPAAAGHVFTLGELLREFGGVLEGRPETPVTGYAIDSRAVGPGTLFFALKGDRTDGHLFLAEARRRGAVAAVMRRDAAVPSGLDALRVDDTALALARLGTLFRTRWPLRVVGVTGSAGKTTTKEFAAALLGGRFSTFKSEGNLNSTFGLPLTLARRKPEHEVAVLELGMSWPGELRRLTRMARPDVAVITNIGLAHVEHFASADDVARAKAEILEGVPPGGVFVANADDSRVMQMAASFPGRSVTFGLEAEADVRALEVRTDGISGTRFVLSWRGKSADAELPVVGLHQLRNALAALAAAAGLDLDPLELVGRLPLLAAAEHRGQVLHLGGEVTVIDDCYNSNPAALATALDALASLPSRRRVAVLGEMRELGTFSEVSHREAGRHAALRADVVVGVGAAAAVLIEEAHASGCREVRQVADAATAADAVAALVRDGDAVLIKGSRGVGLEVVVEALRAARPPEPRA